MLISGREAAGILAGAGLAREQARRLLLAGFAGDGLRTRGSLLYDAANVSRLAEWPIVEASDLAGVCPDGVFLQRAWRGIHVEASHADQLAALRLRWWLSPWARVQLRDGIATRGHFPFVATVSGYVAVGGDIVALDLHGPRDTELRLAEPSDWFSALRGRRYEPGLGGPWMLWTTRPPTLQQ
jgi:hypothetical protein